MAKKGNRQYTNEFKAATLKKIADGQSVSYVGKASGVHYGTIYAWMKAAKMPTPNVGKVGGAAVPKVPHLAGNSADSSNTIRDVQIYLRHARTEILKEVATGKLTRANLLTLLALDALEGNH